MGSEKKENKKNLKRKAKKKTPEKIKVRERWRFLNKCYGKMTRERLKELEQKKITAKEVKEWFVSSGVKTYQLAGGLAYKGWTAHDIEFVLTLPSNMPFDCSCRKLLSKLNPLRFKVPISGFCTGCGAGFRFDHQKNEWDWFWDHTRYQRKRKFGGVIAGGVTYDKLVEIIKRIEKLEAKLKRKPKQKIRTSTRK